eukprot:CAMPEP_0202895508 /NCGR_PEP_ID=MMETSP1392-20130828/4689_1 /ASSEMBLY_ACC=CAM_ASM_000868 /TAXON_ID=225041 /ORGANISM="Chlamydomonas chlamydogama, Strain SAG 11-48b" /LENGTH=245 /DNA_ID=CAMNT_0049580533 /DNA_START=152 /DNA_END=889 /DNA_ORIENTATION=-
MYLSDEIITLNATPYRYNKSFTLSPPNLMAIQLNISAGTKFLLFPARFVITVGDIGGGSQININILTQAVYNNVKNTLAAASNDTARASFYNTFNIPGASARIRVYDNSPGRTTYTEYSTLANLVFDGANNSRVVRESSKYNGASLDLNQAALAGVGTNGGPLYIVYHYFQDPELPKTMPTTPVSVGASFTVASADFAVPPNSPAPPTPPSPPLSASPVAAPNVLIMTVVAAACVVLSMALMTAA